MENKISKILTFDDGSKYIIAKQAVYKNEVYYIITSVNNEETEILDDFKLVKEVNKDGNMFMEEVTDKETVTIILKHLGLLEE